MTNNFDIFSILFVLPFLYAETHYRFKYFFSWLKKSEPEIIADIPSRISIDESIPLLIILKDADKYPVEIINVSVFSKENIIFSMNLNQPVTQPYFETILYIHSKKISAGHHQFNIAIKYKIKGKIKTCFNDNHRGTSHLPLPIYISRSQLPKIENCIFGETHCHTNYTSDQVEFAASIKSSSILAKAMGLKFFCATDHSYDLDDESNNYLINDPHLNKWKKFKNEVNEFNSKNKNFCIVPGEEASLNNFRNRNIHCLIFNSEKFYPGSGDSGEKWLRPYSELSIDKVLNDIGNQTLVFAAHPVEPVPFLQRWLIRRDNWYEEDCKHPRLHGLQFANGGKKKYFELGKQLWINLLLQGFKLTGLAGNDAHGNFARYRQVSLPFVSMKEKYLHLFGIWRTGIYLDSINLNKDVIIESLKRGNCFLTNGPALQLKAYCQNTWYNMGSHCNKIEKIKFAVKSTDEFGSLNKANIYLGIVGEKEEQLLFHEKFDKDMFKENFNYTSISLTENGYIRAEVETESGKIAISNPIWF